MRDDNYDELLEDFLDKVFDTDGILPRTNFEKQVRLKYPAVFDASELRKIVLKTPNVSSDEDSEFEESDSGSE